MKVMGISGLPGSGKSLISEMAKEKGAIIVNMGDCVREEAAKRNLSLGKTAIELRKEQGDFVVAKLTIKKLKSLETPYKNTLYIIEGIRSPYEVELFKENFKDFLILSVYASPKTRFKRVINRNREDDFNEIENFNKRDKRELDFGIGIVIALSDYLIVNDSNLEEYKEKIEIFFNKKENKFYK
ncbi:MAG: AAA family ATPase [Methanobrevibacter sp.]|jgi:dephospho-CoA kinase|nr:AAA family ATPase [Methanobrevibacter sp.]